MRNALFLVGMLAVVACSVDHVVVAALDEPSRAGSSGGESGSAGDAAGAHADSTAGASSGGTNAVGSGGANGVGSGGSGVGGVNRNAGGVAGVDGIAFDGVGGGVVVTIGGSSTDGGVLIGSGGESGTIHLFCGCAGEKARVCGSDGLTYDVTCDDGTCLPPTIECWHGCPCVDSTGSTDTSITPVYTPECASALCESYFCWVYRSAVDDLQTICDPTN